MQQVKDLFNNYRLVPAVKSRRTERGDLVTEFTERINSDRGKLKPMTISSIAFFLSPYSVPDLYLLLKKCNEAKSFGAFFWYYVKPKLSPQ